LPRLIISATEDGALGPWNGPYTIKSEPEDIAPLVTYYVMTVVAGMSSYNKQAWEESSLLRSYAVECFEEIREETPEVAAFLENLEVDCSPLPDLLRGHAMWKLHRAILGCLPGANFTVA